MVHLNTKVAQSCLFAIPWTIQCLCLQCRTPGFDPWAGKIPGRRERLPTPVFWSGEFHGLENSMGFQRAEYDLATFTSFDSNLLCINCFDFFFFFAANIILDGKDYQ